MSQAAPKPPSTVAWQQVPGPRQRKNHTVTSPTSRACMLGLLAIVSGGALLGCSVSWRIGTRNAADAPIAASQAPIVDSAIAVAEHRSVASDATGATRADGVAQAKRTDDPRTAQAAKTTAKTVAKTARTTRATKSSRSGEEQARAGAGMTKAKPKANGGAAGPATGQAVATKTVTKSTTKPTTAKQPVARRTKSNATKRNTTKSKGGASTAAPAAVVSRPVSADEAACLGSLRRAGVAFERVASKQAPGVTYPIVLTGELGGVRIHGGRTNSPTRYLDCRLAQALLAWAPTLRAAGITGIQHYSMYRNQATVAGTQKQSGHALGMAIDAARFTLADGRVISVLDDWQEKTRGADPCRARPGDGPDQRLMRDVVCRAAGQNLFQTIITPHYNTAHHNHLHLEVAAHGRRTWMR